MDANKGYKHMSSSHAPTMAEQRDEQERARDLAVMDGPHEAAVHLLLGSPLSPDGDQRRVTAGNRALLAGLRIER